MSPQSSIAHYRIISKLGEGGMGEVYRAIDTRLSREVAIKVIPESFAADPDRMARFTREAQVLASLNHPNIAAIYGVEERAIVMELVEGATLAGPLPVEEAIPLARQIAEALEYAHEKGVIHRDLKPANIKVTPQGRVKVLDFGLAKAFSSEASAVGDSANSPTLTMRATMAGMILGTAAYMSPEQAKGKPVDRRADIWSFGVVLWELLTGRQMFGGETASETLASVIKDPPPLDALPPSTPAAIRRLIARCLEKDPQRRLRDIGEARIALEDVRADAAPAAVVEVRHARWPYVAAAVCGVAALLAGIGWWRATLPVDRPLLNFSVDLGPEAVTGPRTSFAVSPDGTRMVYLRGMPDSRASLGIRELNQPRGAVLTGTEGAELPFFSPDGQWVGFFADGKLKKIPVSGGAAITLCDAPNSRGADWGEDGQIVFAPNASGGLLLVAENGGNPEPLIKLEPEERSHRWPQWLPGGGAVIINTNSSVINWDAANIAAYSLKTRQRKTLVRGGYYGRYLPGGYLVYVREGKLLGVRFDATRLEISGQPIVLLPDVAGHEPSGGGQFDIARNGLLVYLAGRPDASRYPFGWMAARGKVEPIKGVTPGVYINPRLSPDGRRLLLSGFDRSLLLWDFEREAMTRLPVALNSWYPVWTPDGRHIIAGSRAGQESEISWQRADGGGAPVKLLQVGEAVLPSSMSPDGRFLAYGAGPLGRGDVWIVPIDATDPEHPKAGAPEPFLRTPADERSAAFSPDGRWLAYDSSESGSREVYVRPFRGGPGKWAVSSGGGDRPRWSPGGRQLFFVTGDNHVMVVDYSVTGDAFSAGKPRRWSDTPINIAGGPPNYDVAPDGKRILAFPVDEQEAGKSNVHATLLVNFFDEVKRRIP